MRVLLVILALCSSAVAAQSHGTLVGDVRDAATGEALIGANVWLVETTLGAATDIEGAFLVRDVPPGRYTVRVSYVGYTPLDVTDLVVVAGGEHRLGLTLAVDPRVEVGCVCCWDGGAPVLDRDPFAGRVVTGDEIAWLPLDR